MEYIYILNYETGECIIRTLPEHEDPELWLYTKGYSSDNIYYMIGNELLLDVKI